MNAPRASAWPASGYDRTPSRSGGDMSRLPPACEAQDEDGGWTPHGACLDCHMRSRRWMTLALPVLAALGLSAFFAPSTPRAEAQAEPDGLFKLDHLIFIVQENRSFDHYFGTFPGADGLPFDPTVGRLR